MNEIITAGPLKFSEPNCPTRVGEIVENIEDIYSIPTPRLGMMVFVKNKGRHYTITSLKSAVIGGVEVPNAQVDTFEPVAIENVGNVDSLDGFTDNGIYQGYHVVSGEVFVLVVINNYAVAAQMGVPTISQFKYSVNMRGQVSFEQRMKDSAWGEWCKVNEPWIVSQLEEIERNLFDYINKCIKDVTDGIDPEKIDSLKDLIAWVEEHGGTVNALWESIEENAGRITSETKRAKQAEEELSDAIRLNYEDIKSLNTNKAEKSDAMQYDTLGVNTYANKAEIYGRSITGTPRVFDFPAATTTKAGVMSADDKAKLDNLSQGGGGGVAELMEEVTYSELVALRDNSSLVAGMKYRITDYVTTTVQQDTKSANHPFDVIVEAVSENELSELARATQHEGDTYFNGNNLSAWQLWYDLDNNTDKYEWADVENGKGVIYRMIDEKRNDCPYDFKNILFYNGKYISNTTSDKYYYTFSYVKDRVLYDGTVEKRVTTCYSNSMGVHKKDSLRRLNKNTWRNVAFGNDCYSNTFGDSCYSNTFGDSCYSNTFGNDCYSNTFGNDCYYRRIEGSRLSITLNDEYYDDGSGQLVPTKHPDLSTQPSILPYKFMGQYVYEQLIPIGLKAGSWFIPIDAKTSLHLFDMSILKVSILCKYEGKLIPMFVKGISYSIEEGVYLDTDMKINGTIITYDNDNAYAHIVYTSMPEEGDSYGYNNY